VRVAGFLFEILCEEIPARMQFRAGIDLENLLTDGLAKAGLTFENVHHWAGPRRLGVMAGIPVKSPDLSRERRGPRVDAPEKVLAGFMRGVGLSDASKAEIREDKKGRFYVAKIEKPGRSTSDILMEVIPNVMHNFPWPKSMKSGDATFRWVRPLRRILCLFDGEIVPVEVGGVTASNLTEGHRQHGRGPYEVTSFEHYKDTLGTDGHVLLDADTRKDKILADAKSVCEAKGLELVEDAGLLIELAGLVEWPVVILGDMDPSFLSLPGEVIRLSMREHQKYFAVRDPKTGRLAPHFVIIANQAAPDGGRAIAAGNSRVLSARLSDAEFFLSEDAGKKLTDYYDRLDTVVFHKQLGSIRDKVERIAVLARELAPKVGADPDMAEQAAKLAKCDLVTLTVTELTSLQGQVGRLMYEKEGGNSDIARAIEEHYKPQGPSDSVPTEPVSVAVALADKLDTLAGFWAIDEKPTGSRDPFALRRSALGVVRIILENSVRIKLAGEIFIHLTNLTRGLSDKNEGTHGNEGHGVDNTTKQSHLVSFIIDRLKVYLKDKGVRHDLIDAALAPGEDDLVAIVNRVEALQIFLTTEDGANLLAGYKRAVNMLKTESRKGALPDGNPDKGTQAEEANLYEALQIARNEINKGVAEESYTGAMTALSKLRAPIDGFFDGVTVNSDNEKERQNRLGLLQYIRDTAHQIADFDRIEGRETTRNGGTQSGGGNVLFPEWNDKGRRK